MSHTPFKRQDFAPSCPSGGTWWACGYGTYFVGCCARDPCDITCAQGNLYPGAFDPASYGDFPDATCGTGSKFYTCSAGDTFWGCCKTNACSQSGCPDGDLEPAILNREDLRSAYHATGGTTLASATRTSTTTSSSATTVAVSRTSDAAITGVLTLSTSSPRPEQNKPHVAVIAGGAAGGAFGLAVIIALLVYYVCHAKKSRKGHTETVVRRLSDLPAIMGEKDKGVTSQVADALPPGYTSPNPDPALFYSYPHISLPAQYGTYAYTPYHQPQQQQQQPYAAPPEPQELPIQPLSPVVPFARKQARHYHRGDVSELSGETAVRTELGTPLPSSLKGPQSPFTQQSPNNTRSQGRPVTLPQTGFVRQEGLGSGQSGGAVKRWMAMQSRGGEGGHGEGLDVRDVNAEEEMGSVYEQREGYGRPDDNRWYHGM